MKNIEFKIIKNSEYSNKISDILNEEDMEGFLVLKYIKNPNLFESLKKDGIGEVIIVVGLDKLNEEIVGVGACTILSNKLAYLNSFRIRKEYRNKINFSKAYKILIIEIEKKGIFTIITSILSDNKIAQNILIKKRKSMPTYEFYKNINFYSIKNKNIRNLEVEDELLINRGDIQIILKKKSNKIFTVKEYKGKFSLFYKLRKIISFFGYPELVEKGKKFDFLFLKIEGDYNPKQFLENIKFIQNAGYNCSFFMIAAYEKSILDQYLSKLKSFKYSSKLYKVYYEKVNYNETEIKFNFWDL